MTIRLSLTGVQLVTAVTFSGYLSEFDFRYSSRKISDGERTAMTIRKAEGKRLTYAATSTSSG
jgi:hypothetical protein